MAGIKIDSLPIIVTPALSDVFPVVQAGVTYKESFTQLSSLFATAGANSNITSLSGLTTPLSAAQGGTGVSNGASTITLGGKLTTSGAFASTFTMTAGTSVTFPTSGTLATTAGTVSSITGTANQVLASASTGAVTLSLPQSIATSSSPTFSNVTGTSGFSSGISGTNSGTYGNATSITTSNSFEITKSITGAASAAFLQITIPASFVFMAIECFVAQSRAPTSAVGTSQMGKYYFSIARNGTGSDVVLDSLAGPNFTALTTTAGGTFGTLGNVPTIARNGSEANTAPQVVNLSFNPLVFSPGGSAGFCVIKTNMLYLGTLTGFVIS